MASRSATAAWGARPALFPSSPPPERSVRLWKNCGIPGPASDPAARRTRKAKTPSRTSSAAPSPSDMSAVTEQLKIVIVGHVDHGKSTFVGRLFHDTGSLPDGKLEQLQKVAERRGVPFEWANLMDALQAERDQNITIDTAQIWFQTKKRQYV